jgi:hypothetical protein
VSNHGHGHGPKLSNEKNPPLKKWWGIREDFFPLAKKKKKKKKSFAILCEFTWKNVCLQIFQLFFILLTKKQTIKIKIVILLPLASRFTNKW